MGKNNPCFCLLLTIALVIMMPAFAFAADADAMPAEDDVTLKKIKTYFAAGFYKTGFNSEGDLKINDGGLKAFIKLDREKNACSSIQSGV